MAHPLTIGGPVGDDVTIYNGDTITLDAPMDYDEQPRYVHATLRRADGTEQRVMLWAFSGSPLAILPPNA